MPALAVTAAAARDAAATDTPTDTRMHQPLLRWAELTPDAPAISDTEGHWSWRELAAATGQAAELLSGCGVRAGERVMLVGENSRALAACIFAVSQLDACAVLENARRAPQEAASIREHAEPRLVLYVLAGSPAAREHARAALAREVSTPLLGRLALAFENPGARPDPRTDQRDDVAALIYTTGTTGTPKGVMVRHAAFLFLSATVRELRAVTAADCTYCVLPITHIMGLAIVMGGALRAGGHLHLIARFDARACARMLAEDGISMLQGAPALFAKLLHYYDRPPEGPERPIACPRLRFIAVGGAPLDARLKAQCEARFGLPLHNGYGLTEGSSLCFTRLEDPRPDTSVGRPLPGVSVRIRGQSGADLATGSVGELWVRGPQVMKGYFREPALTRRVLSADGWFNTEDLARLDEAGNVYIVGRSKDLIARSGFKVYPLEVEDALNRHPGIVHSAVLGRTDPESETVIAFVELAEPAAPFDLDALRGLCAQWLSPYKRPGEIYALPALPASPNGKVLKQDLRALLADEVAMQRLHRIL